MPSTSRITHGKGVASSTSTERFVPFMLRRPRATPLGAWEEALSNSDRTRQCAGAASRDCTALWWIGIFGHERKREAKRRSSLRTAEPQDQKRISGLPCRRFENVTITVDIRLSKRHSIGIAELYAKERPCQGYVPLGRQSSSTESRSC